MAEIGIYHLVLTVGPILKAGYTRGMGGITPAGNADAFLSTPFDWFCPRPVSLIAHQNVPLSVLLNAGRCEHLWPDLALLFFARERSDELPKDSSSSIRVSSLLETMCSFPLLRAVVCFAWLLSCTSFSLRSCLFLLGLADNHFHATDVQRDLAVPSSVLPAPPVSSPCLDANEEIDLQVT